MQSVLTYIQTWTVKIKLSRVGCILPVSIYMYLCTIHLTELTVAWQNSKPVQNAGIFSKMQLISNCYKAELYESISKLFYIYKKTAVSLSDCRVTFFLASTGIESPDKSIAFHDIRRHTIIWLQMCVCHKWLVKKTTSEKYALFELRNMCKF